MFFQDFGLFGFGEAVERAFAAEGIPDRPRPIGIEGVIDGALGEVILEIGFPSEAVRSSEHRELRLESEGFEGFGVEEITCGGDEGIGVFTEC